MKLYELLDQVRDCADCSENVMVLVEDGNCAFEIDSVEIAPSGNVFIKFNNWYMDLLKEKGYLKEPNIKNDYMKAVRRDCGLYE